MGSYFSSRLRFSLARHDSSRRCCAGRVGEQKRVRSEKKNSVDRKDARHTIKEARVIQLLFTSSTIGSIFTRRREEGAN